MNPIVKISLTSLLLLTAMSQSNVEKPRPRARELGVVVGVLPPGKNNAITDVAGVRVGHATLIKGDNVRTGVTAILPHAGNLFQEKVPAAIFVGNGFGKLMGSTQVNELGEIETPILLTNTLNVPRVADALIEWMLQLPGNEQVRSINPIVAETNDGFLNDIRGRHVGRDEVFAAIRSAKDGPVEEGAVGAGTGTVAFGWKGGIGTASRVVPQSLGGYTVGALVQSNYGGVLTINGAPVGRELGKYYLKEQVEGRRISQNLPGENQVSDRADGSIIMVVATDAPMDARNLKRLAARAMLGLARTGSPSTNGSGDYVIAFSTANRVRASENLRNMQAVGNEAMSPLFEAVVEATEEAIYNSMFKATTVTGRDGHRVEALPIEKTVEILKKYGAVK
ncbi:MAG: Beta-peptidyl aminopeptidase BapA [Acidobacteria bacterium]|nr:Beta-peptidyl aminopeptidase BapA [Acidobacteriota bacterium]